MKRIYIAELILVTLLTQAGLAQGPGNALQFDGVDDYVEMPDNDGFTGSALSIEAWIYPSEVVGTERIIVSKYNSSVPDISWTFYKQADGRLVFQVQQDPGTVRVIVQDVVSLTANQWQHVAATYDVSNQNMFIYVNGVATSTTLTGSATLSSIYNGTVPVRVGTAVNGAGQLVQFWSGNVDELRIWSSFVDASQIRTRMHTQLTGNESGLVAYYRFDESSGNLDDGTSNNLDGVLVGGPIRTTSTAPVGGGYGNVQTVSTAGSKNFPTTNLLLNFTNKSGTDDFLSTLLNDSTATGTLPTGSNTYTKRYWIVEKFGSGTFTGNATFELGSGAISSADAAASANLKLYRRNANGSGTWTEVGSASAATTANVTFNGLSQAGQYMIGTTGTSTFYSSGDITFTESAAGSGTFNIGSPLDLGDYDNDGYLDIIVAGENGTTPTTKLFKNQGNGTFTDAFSSMQNLYAGGVQWNDYNNDGYLDLAMLGSTTHFADPLTSSGTPALPIYKGDGTTNFVLDTSLSPIPLRNLPINTVWGDYNFDGKSDLLVGGLLYKNIGGSGHTFQNLGFVPDSIWASIDVAWCDYDGDGDLDLIYTAGYNLPFKTQLWRNDGSFFTHVTAPVDGFSDFPQLSQGSVVWGDYDNDGKPDLAICGGDGTNNHTKIYKNNGNSVFHDISAPLTGMQGTLLWGDFDNDGWLDLQASGYDASTPYSKHLYWNNQDGTFTAIGAFGITTIGWGNSVVGDYDRDGRLDIAMTGINNSNNEQQLILCHNNTSVNPNAKPTAPTIRYTVPGGDSVRISWNRATDNETPSPGLTYNLRMGTSPGGINTISPLADVATGLRRVARQGNVWHDTAVVIHNLPNGTYYWSVQAIDNNFDGGLFSEEKAFSIGVPPLAPSNLGETHSGSQVTLSWTASVGTVTLYRIFRGSTPNPTTQVDSTTGTSKLQTNVPAGNNYYRVAAVNSNGQSSYSNEVSVLLNSAPVFKTLGTFTVLEDGFFTTLLDTITSDPDHHDSTLIYSILTNGSKGTAVLNGRVLTYTCTANANGSDAVTIRVQDPIGAADTTTLNISITPVNDPPMLTHALRDTSFNEDFGADKLIFKLSEFFSDVDNTLSYSLTLIPTGRVTALVSNDSLRVSSVKDSNGVVDIKVAASDGQYSVVDTLRLTITPVNDAPKVKEKFQPDSLILAKNFIRQTIDLSNHFEDIDNPTLTLSATTTPSGKLTATIVNNDQLRLDSISGQTGEGIIIKVEATDVGSLKVADTLRVSIRGLTLTTDNFNPSLPAFSEAQAGNNVFIQFQTSSPVASATLFYKEGGKATFNSLAMTPSGGGWSKDIPGSVVASRGVSYYLMLTDGVDTIYSPSGAPANVNNIEVSVSSAHKNGTQANGKTASAYRIVSVPLRLGNTNFSTLFQNFGTFDDFNEGWTLYQWKNKDYVKIDVSSDTLVTGQGYMFITSKDGQTITTGAGKTNPTNAKFPISLSNNDWTMFGNPFNFNVAWSAVEGNSVGMPVTYNGTDFPPADVLNPWEGYFIKNPANNPVTIKIPAEETLIAGRISKAGFFADRSSFQANEWQIQIKTSAGELEDKFNYAGMSIRANDQFDSDDMIESPRHPGNEFIKLYFDHSDWTEYAGRYGSDFRGVNTNGDVWDFDVNALTSAEKIPLDFDQLDYVPADFHIILVDKDLKVTRDLRQNPHYEFISKKGSEFTRHFRLIIGKKDFVDQNLAGVDLIPEKIELAGNYPNPFNPTTVIKWALPARARASLTIYNVLGQKVRALVDEITPEGSQLTFWDGRNDRGQVTSSGVYLYRLVVRDLNGAVVYSKTKKMLLIK